MFVKVLQEVGELEHFNKIVSIELLFSVTLTRAAKKWQARAPSFALAVSVAALKHICAGRIYEIEFGDVLNAFECAQEAGRALGLEAEAAAQLRAIVESDVTPGKFVRDWLGRRVGLDTQADSRSESRLGVTLC